MPSFAAQQSLFRAYDIRGSRQHFNPELIQALGAAFAQLYNSQERQKNTVVIGFDVRCGSEAIARTLADILRQHGLPVIQLGLITTPMMAYWAEQYHGHGIIVTASHSAKDILGVKWLLNQLSPSSADIQTLYQQLSINHAQHKNRHQKDNRAQNTIARSNTLSNTNNSASRLSAEQVAISYIDAIEQVFKRLYPHNDKAREDNHKPHPKLDLILVIDCMNGATSNIAQRLFARFCQQLIMLNDTADGSFPSGNPDPTEPNRLVELQRTVIVNKADIGLAFDGDGDRLMIVDNSGKVVTPDHLLYLLAQVALTERPQSLIDRVSEPQVLFDIKCSHHLSTLLSDLGATPIISRTGSSLMRQQLQSCDSDIIFAGELSGHFIFNDGYFVVYDDAMYAGLRLLHWLTYTAASHIDPLPAAGDIWDDASATSAPYQLTDITKRLPTLVSTADHYLPLPNTAPTSCSIVRQLAEFCYYLQRLVSQPINDFNEKPAACASSLCTCAMQRQSMSSAQARHLLPLGTRLSCIDGVRLDFANGFGVLRQSNTSHNLTARFAGDSIEDLKEVQARFVALCQPFDKDLAAQIAAILPE